MTDQIVIGAGFGRTGTMSLREALNILGLGPTYHMKDCIMNNHLGKWVTLSETGSKHEQDKILCKILTGTGYKSSVDFPTSVWFKEILDLRKWSTYNY